jgi:hypothetical protein
MNNQNIISNKFDLNWSTSFSFTGVHQFFSKSRSLHYILRKRRNLPSYKGILEIGKEGRKKEMTLKGTLKNEEQNSTMLKETTQEV